MLCRARQDALVRLTSPEVAFGERQFGISAEIPPAPTGDWTNYAQGAAQWLQRASARQLLGIDVLVEGRAPLGIPRGAGLSSSSALTVALMLALAERNGIELSGVALTEACSHTEWYVETRGGIMDHLFGRAQPGSLPGLPPRRRGPLLLRACASPGRLPADGGGIGFGASQHRPLL